MGKRNIKPTTKKAPLQEADILKTHGSNAKILKITKFKKFEKIDKALNKTIDWYREYYNK